MDGFNEWKLLVIPVEKDFAKQCQKEKDDDNDKIIKLRFTA